MQLAVFVHITGLIFSVICQLSFMFNHRHDIVEATKGFPLLVVFFNMTVRLSTFYCYRRKIEILKEFSADFLSSKFISITWCVQKF